MPAEGKPEGSAPHGCGPKRLLKRKDFLAVRRGEKRRGRLFLVEVLDRGDQAEPRVGFTVTKKTGNAVERNRIRRRLREAAKTALGHKAQPGFDYVLIARREAISASFPALVENLSRAVTRLHK